MPANSFERPHLREEIDSTSMSGRSINLLLKKLTALTAENSRNTVPYTVGDLKAEYDIPVNDHQLDAAAGRRWSTSVAIDGIMVDCEVTTFAEDAKELLIASGLKSKPLGATLWFSERTTIEETSSLSLLASIYEGGPAKHDFGRAEVSGELTLAGDRTNDQEERLFSYSKIVGVQAIFSHFAPEASDNIRDFYIEAPQMVGSDMVRAAGKLAMLPQLIQ